MEFEEWALTPVPVESQLYSVCFDVEWDGARGRYKCPLTRAAHEAWQARAALDMWQPIETAPKDGTEIIGFNGTIVSPYSWESSPDDDGHTGWCKAGYTYGGVLYEIHYAANPEPTHWMPLPSAPVDAGELTVRGE